jgi:Tfp pilus assembly PilM family ATPase/Tfp pilus assembly protein PilN
MSKVQLKTGKKARKNKGLPMNLGSLFKQSKVGLYIGPRQVTVVEIIKDLKQTKIVRAASAAIVNKEGEISAEDPLVMAIKAAIRKAEIKSKNVSIAIQGQDVFLRFFEMSLLAKKEWANAVKFEARKYTPFEFSELQSDFLTFPDTKRKKLKVVFAGARRQSTQAIFKAVSEAGLQVVSAEPVYFSLLRMFLNIGKEQKKGTRMFVDVDATGAIFTVVAKDSVPLLARQSMAAGFNVEGNPETDAFVPEIRPSYDYFTRSFKGQKIDSVVLSATNEVGLSDLLKQELSLPVEVADPLARVKGKYEATPGAMRAAGAALGSMAIVGKDTVNLAAVKKTTPIKFDIPQMAPAQEKVFLKRLVIVETVVLVILFSLGWLMMSTRAGFAERDFAALRQENVSISSKYGADDIEDLRDYETSLLSKSQMISELVQRRVIWTDKMNEIAKALPDDVWLTRLSYNKGSLEIEGRVSREKTSDVVRLVNQFADALAKNEVFMIGFNQAGVGSIRKDSGSKNIGASFTIGCRKRAD